MAGEARGCLASVFGMFSGSASPGARDDQRQAKPTTFPYERADRFLSLAEAAFLTSLRAAVADEYEVFAKVRLLDLLKLKAGEGRQAALNRVQAKQLDFLLCERGTSRPVLAIELDDSSHQRSDRRARDAFVEEVLVVIGLPALRVPVTRAYDAREIARLIRTTISQK